MKQSVSQRALSLGLIPSSVLAEKCGVDEATIRRLRPTGKYGRTVQIEGSRTHYHPIAELLRLGYLAPDDPLSHHAAQDEAPRSEASRPSVVSVEDADAEVARARAILFQRQADEADARDKAVREVRADGSEALSAAKRLIEATLLTGLAKDALDQAEREREDTIRAQHEKVREEQAQALRFIAKERSEAGIEVAEGIETLVNSWQKLNRSSSKMGAFLGPRNVRETLTSGSMLQTLVSCEFARYAPEVLLGGQPAPAEPPLPGSASRSEVARASIEGRPASLVEAIRLANDEAVRVFEAGGRDVKRAEPPNGPLRPQREGSLESTLIRRAPQTVQMSEPERLKFILDFGYDPTALVGGQKKSADEVMAAMQKFSGGDPPPLVVDPMQAAEPLRGDGESVGVELPNGSAIETIKTLGYDPATVDFSITRPAAEIMAGMPKQAIAVIDHRTGGAGGEGDR